MKSVTPEGERWTEVTDEGFRTLLEKALNAVLKAESAEQLNAGSCERNSERTGYRNGWHLPQNRRQIYTLKNLLILVLTKGPL